MTAQAVESVLAQSFRDFELILVDDGSTDRTPELDTTYRGQIRYIRQENRGVSAARNMGIMTAKADWITFLDSDDLWLPGKLERDSLFIQTNSESRIHQCRDIWIRNGVRVNPSLKHIKQEGDIFIPSLDLCLISPSSVAIRRDLLDETGLFDEDLPACEDYDLWLRITWRERIGLIRENLIIRHAGHGDQLSARFNTMDRFRLYAILKLLCTSGDKLPEKFRAAAINSAVTRCLIISNGARKRGNPEMADMIENLIEPVRDGRHNRKDVLNPLKKYILP